MKLLYSLFFALLVNLSVFAQDFGPAQESAPPKTQAGGVPDRYVAMAVVALFAIGVFVLVAKFRQQRGRKLKRQYPQPEDIEQIRRRLRDVA